MHYVESGDPKNRLIVFLHGFPEFWYSWRYQIRYLQSQYHILALDLRGLLIIWHYCCLLNHRFYWHYSSVIPPFFKTINLFFGIKNIKTVLDGFWPPPNQLCRPPSKVKIRFPRDPSLVLKKGELNCNSALLFYCRLGVHRIEFRIPGRPSGEWSVRVH